MHMQKWRAFAISVTSIVGAFASYNYQHQYTLMWACIVCAIAFFGIWLDKVIVDINILSNAQKDLDKGARYSQTTPEMTTKGSRRLFVPEPLNVND